MAEDIHSEGSEEEKKDDSQQDEDFGLPDLEFEELEELDLNIDEAESSDSSNSEGPVADGEVLTGSDDIDMSVLDDIEVSDEPTISEEPQATQELDSNTDTALDQGIDEIEDVLDSAQLISDRLGEDDDDDEADMPTSDIPESSKIVSDDAMASEEIEIEDISADDLSTESVTGLTDEELEALMTPPEPVPDVDSILSSGSDDVDDILASIDSPDDLEALGITDDDLPPEVDTEDTVGSSLFAADDDMSAMTTDSSEELDMSDFDMGEKTPDSSLETETVSNDADSSDSNIEMSDSIFEAGAVEGGSIFESDSIALDATSNEKVEFQSPENASLPPNYKPYTYEEATTGNFAKVIVIGVVVISLIGLALLYFHMQSDDEGKEGKKIAKTEKTQKPVAKKATEPVATNEKDESTKADDNNSKSESVKKDEPIEKVVKKETPVQKEPVKKTVVKAPVQTASAEGQIIAVKEKTGRVYAIIGSFIDEDIAMDYANELSAQGKGVKIIYPYGNSRNYRVTIADYGSISEATSNIDNIKADYGDQVWALKY